MNQLEYINAEIVKADQARSEAPGDAVRNGYFARIRKLKFALEIFHEMEAKKIYPPT